ncbi:hypothetical protein C900_05641 [Fulvivirga imtechensis AK7]|uniref:Uncharacterized protein n=1 Tax=Fulvivirga imtechensis AK7 TaxID=1237149 RepID=L8JL43_9BACT|nr:hypothetical protein [Fulvivirga imtechensis]ELR68948.1 hypothetical protein C900_05641 [Fulvivirga imtechensis AK7]
MKTTTYNPSPLEVEIAQALEELQGEIGKRLAGNEIVKVENRIAQDNPLVKFYFKDSDGDPHEVVFKIIQTPDKF